MVPFSVNLVVVNQFWWNLVHNSKLGPKWQSRDQTLQFLKFKMADGRHIGKYWKWHNSPQNGPIWTKLGWWHPIIFPTCPPWCSCLRSIVTVKAHCSMTHNRKNNLVSSSTPLDHGCNIIYDFNYIHGAMEYWKKPNDFCCIRCVIELSALTVTKLLRFFVLTFAVFLPYFIFCNIVAPSHPNFINIVYAFDLDTA